MYRKFEFSEGEFYHIYNRGVNKYDIFLNNHDKDRFIRLLFLCNSDKPIILKEFQGRSLEDIERKKTIVDIVAYCLMPNHFHILIKEKIEGGITLFMKKILTAYSMYFNKKNNRTGPLFESRFKATHANEDNYLKYLLSYIHLNPVKLIDPKWKEAGITDKEKTKIYLNDYKYSSYMEYTGVKREENVILNTVAAPLYFVDHSDFNSFIDEWINYSTIN